MHQYQIGGILDKTVEIVKNSRKPKGQEDVDLIFQKLNKKRGGRGSTIRKMGFRGQISKKWLFIL